MWIVKSRKFWIAIATVISVVVAHYFKMSDTEVYSMLAVGIAWLTGIAIEDNGSKSSNSVVGIKAEEVK